MTPSRPYLVRALIDWIVDNGCTPHIAIACDVDGVSVPEEHTRDGRIVLNLSAAATRNLDISDDAIVVDCRFGGRPQRVSAPIGAVVAVFARENGQGMAFEPESPTPASEQAPASDASKGKNGPRLSLVE